MLLVFGAPCQLRLLAGQEHGRTIPLGDIIGQRIERSSLADFHSAARCLLRTQTIGSIGS
jgi:hypothetical protein